MERPEGNPRASDGEEVPLINLGKADHDEAKKEPSAVDVLIPQPVILGDDAAPSEVGVWKCLFCAQDIHGTEGDFDEHRRTCDETNWCCYRCNGLIHGNREKYDEHQLNCTGVGVWTCDHCGKDIHGTRGDFDEHMRTCDEVGVWTCGGCGQDIHGTRGDFDEHIRTCDEVNRQCSRCNGIIHGNKEKFDEHQLNCTEVVIKTSNRVIIKRSDQRYDRPGNRSQGPCFQRIQQPAFERLRPFPEEDTDGNFFTNRATAEKFARISLKTRVRDTAHCLWKQWKLPRPELLLFIIDVEPSEEEMRDDRLNRDLCTLGEKIKILATTMGKRRGQPALLDLVRQETDRKPPGLFSVALRSWEGISEETKEFLESGEPYAGPEVEAELGEDHGFFLLTDADTQDDASKALLPDIVKFRQRLEEELMWKGTAKLPAVYLLAGGGKTSWDYMIAALKKRIPVIVLADSGGLAHDLFELWKAGDVEENSTEDGMRQTRLNVNSVPEDLRRKFKGFSDLPFLLGKFKYIQFYSSKNKEDSFEDVLYQAFIQAHRGKELAELLKKTLDLASRQSGTVSTAEKASERGESKPTDTAVKVLVRALVFDCPDVVERLLNQGLDLQTDFEPSQLEYLYAQVKKSNLLFELAKSAGKGTEEKVTIADSRQVVHDLLQNSTYPLECLSGQNDLCSYYCKRREKCCMVICQKLFLWAVLMGRGKMAEVFWKVMPERMSSALTASALFNAMEEKEEDDENKKRLSANARRFQEVAKGTLDMTYKMDEKATHELLSLPSMHWTTTNIQDLAFDFASTEFVASEAFNTKLDSVWRGDTAEDTGLKSDGKQDAAKRGMVRKFCTSPRIKFILAQISTIAFLLLYAFVILFQTTPQQFTPAEIVLCVWVFTLSVQELFQMFPRDDSRGAWLKVKNYFKEIWNIIDFLSILIFIFGMVLRFIGQKNWNYQGPSPDDVTEDMTTVFHLAHVVLSLDFVLFMARLLQVFCVYQHLGPMVTMIFKMLRDLVTFMIILILVCLAYAVTSHAILYPNGQTPFTGEKIFEIPGQAFWSIFGDLSIIETLQAKPVENGEATCSYNRSVVAAGELPACPDSWSRYLVPVMLGFYVMMANVLLLNLLVAIFGNTYSSVEEQADVHWRWQRFVVIREFQKRTLLPPPLNILSMMCDAAIQIISNCACKGYTSAPGMPQEILWAKLAAIFEWEKEISDKFVNDQKTKEEDSSVNAINGLTRSVDYIMSTLWGLERTIQEMRESMPMTRPGGKSIRTIR